MGTTGPNKYTEEFVISELKDMLQTTKDNPKIYTLIQLFEDKDYSRQRFSEWSNKYSDNTIISDTIGKIEDIIKARLLVKGIDGETNANMTKFALINNHGMSDRVEHGITGNMSVAWEQDESEDT